MQIKHLLILFISLFPLLSISQNNLILRFAIASDGHYGESKTNYKEDHENIVDWFNGEFENKGLDYVFFNGDIINDDTSFFPEVKKYFNRLKAPYYAIKGNHDRVFNTEWESIWGYPDNHAFEDSVSAYLLINTTLNNTNTYLCPDNKWLNEKLVKYKEKKHLFIFMHITPHTWTDHAFKNCVETRNIIEKHSNVKAIFHGHDHQEDNCKILNNKHYFWCGHIGSNLDWGVPYKGYRIVEVYKNDSISTYMYNPVDSVIINNNSLF